MTITASMLGVCVSPQEAPTEVREFSDVTALYSVDRPSSVSLSRAAIAARHLDRLLEAYQSHDLYYLRQLIAVLDSQEIARAIDSLDDLFGKIRDDADRARACATWECTAEQLVAAATAPEVTPLPDDPQDEDGESLQHVIGYLKAHAVVLRHARAHGLKVLHGHSHRLDGTDA
jgi:hypothetical protein